MNSRLVIITGGGKGLGLAITRALLSEGYSVLVASRSRSAEISDLENQCEGRIYFEALDLNQISEIHVWCTTVVEKYGIPYALINNSAVAHGGVLGTMHESEIIETITVNVTATIVLTKYLSRSMLRLGEGRIVNISSIVATTGFNGLSVYAASKSALAGFTKSLARELGKANITVNAVAPGYMSTSMTEGINDIQLEKISRRSALKRLVSTDEAASALVYLLSDSAGGITGTTITVDAGNTA